MVETLPLIGTGVSLLHLFRGHFSQCLRAILINAGTMSCLYLVKFLLSARPLIMPLLAGLAVQSSITWYIGNAARSYERRFGPDGFSTFKSIGSEKYKYRKLSESAKKGKCKNCGHKKI